MNSTTEQLNFTVPLSFEAHTVAQNYSQQQSNPPKAKQVYLNTLAVYAVDFYLRCMGFETDWEASYSRNPTMLKLMDLADLEVKNLGKIECRPVLPDAEIVHIPYDVWGDRIGYVAVQFDQSLTQATLLGFTKTAAQEVSLSNLRSNEDFLAYLSRIKEHQPARLRNWFLEIIEEGWQSVSELLSPKQLESAFSFRSSAKIAMGQKIDLGMELDGQSVALIVVPLSEAESEVKLKVQVSPMGSQTYLPEGVKLEVIDESGEAVLVAEAREADNLIQLEFSAESGEEFSVSVSFGEAKVTQQFII